jgi:hypothetical protein
MLGAGRRMIVLICEEVKFGDHRPSTAPPPTRPAVSRVIHPPLALIEANHVSKRAKT